MPTGPATSPTSRFWCAETAGRGLRRPLARRWASFRAAPAMRFGHVMRGHDDGAGKPRACRPAWPWAFSTLRPGREARRAGFDHVARLPRLGHSTGTATAAHRPTPPHPYGVRIRYIMELPLGGAVGAGVFLTMRALRTCERSPGRPPPSCRRWALAIAARTERRQRVRPGRGRSGPPAPVRSGQAGQRCPHGHTGRGRRLTALIDALAHPWGFVAPAMTARIVGDPTGVPAMAGAAKPSRAAARPRTVESWGILVDRLG